MLYLTKVERLVGGRIIYHLFETRTDSVIECTEPLLKELLIKHRMEAKNVYIENGKVKIKSWPYKIDGCSADTRNKEKTYILLGKANKKEFALIGTSGRRVYMGEKELKRYIYMRDVVNCSYTVSDKSYQSIDTHEMKRNRKLEDYTEQRYTEFTAKSLLLGLRISFNYAIENEDVKLTDYTGNSEKVILPSFITAICEEAFVFNRIQEIKLNNGLKYIGRSAFRDSKIDYIEIPETVEFIGKNAFGTGWAPSKENQKRLHPNIVIIE